MNYQCVTCRGQKFNVQSFGQFLKGSSSVLGDCDDCVYFDSEGNFGSGKMKKRTSQNFTRDQAAQLPYNVLFRRRTAHERQ